MEKKEISFASRGRKQQPFMSAAAKSGRGGAPSRGDARAQSAHANTRRGKYRSLHQLTFSIAEGNEL